MENLKKELLQAQKTRDDLMKWKLVLVSGIGSAALGFSKSSVLQHAELALCLIPFACCYADLLCRNLSIRTKLISRFLSKELSSQPEEVEMRFERFYGLFDKERKMALESVALVISTWILSLAVVPVGVSVYFSGSWTWNLIIKWPSVLFVSSAIGGLLASLLVEFLYSAQKRTLDKTVAEWGPQKGRNKARDSYTTWAKLSFYSWPLIPNGDPPPRRKQRAKDSQPSN